jgi:hypothetical protein
MLMFRQLPAIWTQRQGFALNTVSYQALAKKKPPPQRGKKGGSKHLVNTLLCKYSFDLLPPTFSTNGEEMSRPVQGTTIDLYFPCEEDDMPKQRMGF